MNSTRYPCHIVMKPEYSRWIFEKSSNITFNQNPSIGSRLVPCGQTYDETNSRFTQFYKRA